MIYWLRPVLVPLVVALFVVSGVTPLLEFLEERLRVTRPVAAGLTFLSGLIMVAMLGLFLWLSVLEMAETGPAYRQQVSALVATSQKWMDWSITDLFSDPGRRKEADSEPEGDAGDWDAVEAESLAPSELANRLDIEDLEEDQAAESIIAKLIETKQGPASSESLTIAGGLADDKSAELRRTIDRLVRDGLTTLSRELFGLLTTTVVVMIFVFFLILGSAKLPHPDSSLRKLNRQVRAYLTLKTTISIVTGFLFGLTLWVFGVPMALTFGLLAFLLNYIPNIGPIVAFVLPVPFILLHPDASWFWMATAISAVAAIQIISGNIVEPKLMGNRSGLHPVIILTSLIFWGMMWGITGMFLAIPMTAGLKIILEGIPPTRPLSRLMAGDWEAVEELQFPT